MCDWTACNSIKTLFSTAAEADPKLISATIHYCDMTKELEPAPLSVSDSTIGSSRNGSQQVKWYSLSKIRMEVLLNCRGCGRFCQIRPLLSSTSSGGVKAECGNQVCVYHDLQDAVKQLFSNHGKKVTDWALHQCSSSTPFVPRWRQKWATMWTWKHHLWIGSLVCSLTNSIYRERSFKIRLEL